MNLVGAYAGNIASNWISTTVEGAKDAAAAYGGNLAGDIIIAGGSLVEGAGRQVGGKVSGYAARYGNWVNGYGEKLKGVPASSLPKSGPLATYKAGGVGAGALKRSASYGPSMSASKALTKTATTKAPNAKSLAKYPTGAVKPYTTYVKDKKEKPKGEEKALSKPGNSKYPTSATGAKSDSKSSTKPNYPKGPSPLKPVNSFPATHSDPKHRASILPAKTTNNKYPSGPQKAYTPSKTFEKPQGLANKAAGGGHIPLPGGTSDAKSEVGGSKGYKPYTPPAKGPEKQGGTNKSVGGGHIPLPGGIGDTKGEAGGSKGYKPYTPPSNVGAGGAGSGANKDNKLDRTFF